MSARHVFRKSAAPVAESSGGNSVIMQNIPTRVVAGLAVAGEAMQLAIWFDDLRRVQPRTVDSSTELLDGFIHGGHSALGLAARRDPLLQPFLNFGLQPAHGACAQAHRLRKRDSVTRR